MSAPRVPGFEIPPPPRDPEFPLLPGTIAPLKTLPAPQSSNAPPADMPRSSVMVPATETWDQSVERAAIAGRGEPQPDAADDAAAWTVGVVLVSILGVAAALAAAASLHRSRPDRPVSVIRMLPPGHSGS